jgi:aminoglycoside phosphotransferase (APT) family kinase protein
MLGFLREELDSPRLEYRQAPTAIESGYANFMYTLKLREAPEAWSGPLVLRIFRGDQPEEKARAEAAIQSSVAALGRPAPRLLFARYGGEPFGACFFVMEQLPGVSLLRGSGLEDGVDLGWIFSHMPRLVALPKSLATHMAALHELPVEPVQEALRREGLAPDARSVPAWIEDTAHSVDGVLPDFAEGLRWIREHQPPAPEALVVCHGDFHPDNMLFEGKTLTGLVDWSDARLAAPAFDVANTRFLFEFAPFELPRALGPLADWLQRSLARDWVKAYRRLRPLDLEALSYYQTVRCFRELVYVARDRLSKQGRLERVTQRRDRGPFDFPRSVERLQRSFREVSGVPLGIP